MKAALRPSQAAEMRVRPAGQAKATSSRYDGYVAEHGTTLAWELEAIEPEALQQLLRVTINSVIDVALFNAAVELEKAHAAEIAKLTGRRAKKVTLGYVFKFKPA
ncbi:MAG: hypothetical protein ACRC33_16260 [Gemmataceae bacterium]